MNFDAIARAMDIGNGSDAEIVAIIRWAVRILEARAEAAVASKEAWRKLPETIERTRATLESILQRGDLTPHQKAARRKRVQRWVTRNGPRARIALDALANAHKALPGRESRQAPAL